MSGTEQRTDCKAVLVHSLIAKPSFQKGDCVDLLKEKVQPLVVEKCGLKVSQYLSFIATSLPLSTHSYLPYCLIVNELSHVYARFIACKALSLGRHPYMLSFSFFIPICECHTLWVVGESRMVCMTVLCLLLML